MSDTLAALEPLATIDAQASGVTPRVRPAGGVSLVADDGSVVVNIGPREDGDDRPDDWDANIAGDLPSDLLTHCAVQLVQDIDADNNSRAGWLDARTRGLALLGLEKLDPRGDAGTSSAPLEGMSSVVAPLLLGEVNRAQATARGELLPASGPVKVVDESFATTGERDELADALEKGMNTYLTEVRTEYYPDTDRMLFYTVFGGCGFKKVFHCPIRRAPVSDSVDAADLIVNAGATNLETARRVTHQIRMRDSDVRRMVLAGAWRDVPLGQAAYQPDAVKEKKAQIEGTSAQPQQPYDIERTIYEVLAEWDFGEGPDGMPVPYRITIDRDSKQVLDVRRNWREDDDLFRARQLYVRFPYIDAIGIYGIGLLHLLGNTSQALTAAWREMLDSGMFANFPGFLYADTMSRQESNEFRVPPGGGVKVQTGGRPIREAIMELPYKQISPTLLEFCTQMLETSKQVAGAAEIPVGEGKANLPVGTVLAMLEQATRVMSAVHKRLHAAQAEEFKLLRDRLREDPEAFWRHGGRHVYPWDKEKFLRALDSFEMAPVSDPNDPTRAHRLLKGQAVKTLEQMSPQRYDGEKVDAYLLRLLGVDAPEQFFVKQAPTQAPDPRAMLAEAKMKETAASIAQKGKDSQLRLVETQIKAQQAAADRQSKERIEAMRAKIEQQKIGADVAVESVKGAHEAAAAMAAPNQETAP